LSTNKYIGKNNGLWGFEKCDVIKNVTSSIRLTSDSFFRRESRTRILYDHVSSQFDFVREEGKDPKDESELDEEVTKMFYED
jgi:hypothetical protein